LTVVAVERYYAICHPLKFKSTMTRTRVIICITWLLAMAVLVPELVVLDIHPSHEAPTVLLTSCRPTWDNQVQIIYQTFIMVALFFLPIAIIGYCYTHVCISLLVNSVPTEPNGYTTGM
jgi:hypocretin (orexin) receptor 2